MSTWTRILIIDDDDVFRRLVGLNLTQEGYSVLEAAGGDEGLRMACDERPDLIILDIMMPGMDGWEVCKRLRQFSSAPIIIVSSRGLPGDKVKSGELGADDYLTKPFDMNELLSRVRTILRKA